MAVITPPATPAATLIEITIPVECPIEAVIKESKLLPAFELACAKTKTCPKNIPTSAPSRYLLKLTVKSTSSEKCAPYYGKDTEVTVFINEADVKTGDKLAAGETIQGVASNSGFITLKNYKLNPQTAAANTANTDILSRLRGFFFSLWCKIARCPS